METVCKYPRFPTCGLEVMDWDFRVSGDANANQATTTSAWSSNHETNRRNWMEVSSNQALQSTTRNYRENKSSSWKPPTPIPRESLVIMKNDDERHSEAFTDEIEWDPMKYGQRDLGSSEKFNPNFSNEHQHFMKSTLNVAMDLASLSNHHRQCTSKGMKTKERMPLVRQVSPTIILTRMNSTTSTTTSNSIVSLNAETSSLGCGTTSDCLIKPVPCGQQTRRAAKCHSLTIKDSKFAGRESLHNQGNGEQGKGRTIGLTDSGNELYIVDTLGDFNDSGFTVSSSFNRNHHHDEFHYDTSKKETSKKDTREEKSDERKDLDWGKDDGYPLQMDHPRESKTILRTRQSGVSNGHLAKSHDDSHVHASLHPACMINSKHYQPYMGYSIQPHHPSYQHWSRRHNAHEDPRLYGRNTQHHLDNNDKRDKFQCNGKQHVPSKELVLSELVDQSSINLKNRSCELPVEHGSSIGCDLCGQVTNQEVSAMVSSSSLSPAMPPYSKVAGCGRGRCLWIRWPSVRSLLVSLATQRIRPVVPKDTSEDSESTQCLVEKVGHCKNKKVTW